MRSSRLDVTRALALIVGIALAVPAAVRADSLLSLPEPDYSAGSRVAQSGVLTRKIHELVYPTIGCPAIVAPGQSMTAIVLLSNGGATSDWSATLSTRADPLALRFELTPQSVAYDAPAGTYTVTLKLPDHMPVDTYDLELISSGLPRGLDSQPNAVRLWRGFDTFTIAHIADTQVRDPNTLYPQKFDQVLFELRLRDVAFTLFSGDINFGSDYSREYLENWEVMRRRALPLVCAPGNHDGYAWLAPNTGALDYDGLHFWRTMFGPTHFALAAGRLRIVATNSFGGPPERRNSLTVLSVNSGGHVNPDELQWIETQAIQAESLGQEMLLFLHHNPYSWLTPSAQAYPWDLANVGAGNATWNDAFSQQELDRIAGDTPALKWILSGHSNRDEHEIRNLGTGASRHDVHYVQTTSPCNGGTPREGYRLLEVQAGIIASVDRPGGTDQSVAFPLGANLALDYLDVNDGTRSSVRAQVVNRSVEAMAVTVRFGLKADSRGYATSFGTIRDVAISTRPDRHLVYVRATIPAASSMTLHTGPDANGRGAQPGSVSAATIGTQPPPPSGSSGCHLAPSQPLRTWPLGLALLALGALSLNQRRW